MSQDFNTAWRAALADALGFVGGGVIGLLAGRALGWEFIGEPGWGPTQILGLLTILVGMGGCRWALRRLLLGNRG
ncbi:hypothetical protein ACQ859_08980 [Roseateles chitinivorans]|uniref:hypothetical protein n=1 Tax=Roseateles chitinivorans TaxID=2917965 RepID=UPI003D671C60